MIEIYTDGACIYNPGPGGWGFVVKPLQGEADRVERFGAETHTTNNRMELQAIIEAMKYYPKGSILRIYTDSKYCRDALTMWMQNWKRNGWKTKDKSPVKNQDLFEEADELMRTRKVRIDWVKGHAGDPLNEIADSLACYGAEIASKN